MEQEAPSIYNSLMPALIYHNGALGDFLTILPAIALWKKQHKQQKTVLLGNPRYGVLARHSGLIEETWDAGSSRFLPLFKDRPDQEALNILKPFNTLILFTAKNSPLIKHAASIQPEYLYVQDPFPCTQSHIIDYHLSLFHPETRTEKYSITFSSSELLKAREYVSQNSPTIAICPGSGSKIKNWPINNFLKIARKLEKKGFKVIWIAGPAEQSFLFPASDNVLFNQDLLFLASLLSLCSAYLGNDSGITHLASLTGCPVVSLFGPSDPQIWKPQGPQTIVIQKPCPCAPCHGQKEAQLVCENECLRNISPDEVMHALIKISSVLDSTI